MSNRFGSRIAEAARWCASRASMDDPANSLRSAALEPAQREAGWGSQVEYVCARRTHLLKAQPAAIGSLPAGRLLHFDPDQSLSDAAAMVESNGFFDADNTPPWDTWIAYVAGQPQRPGVWTSFDSFLLCWVPAAFVELVDRAISVNPEQCLRWADEP